MQDLDIIKKFLRKKKGYLKKGNEVCAYALLKKNYLREVSYKLIKQAKEEVKKELKDKVSFSSIPLDVIEDFRDHIEDNRKKLEHTPFAPTLVKAKSPEFKTTPSIKDQVGMHILLGCNHVPFHNKKLHHGIRNLMRDYKYNIKGFHLLGDFADINTLSSHDKGRFTAVPGLTLNMEYDSCNEELDLFEKELSKDVWKTYMYGNHEDRHNRWMSNMDNAKTPLLSPMDGMMLEDRGYHVKNKWSQDYFTLGADFQIFHGIYFSIHNAKAHLDKLRSSCAYVHTHRIQNYREGKMAAFNIGACADFTTPAFNYATRPMKAQWANGFAINMIDEQGRSNLTQIYVNPDGSFWFGGRLY
jgi:hypothetical protein